MHQFSLRRHGLLTSVGLAAVLSVSGPALSQERSGLRMPQTFVTDDGTNAQDSYTNSDAGTSTLSTDGAVETVIERYPNGAAKIQRGVTLDADGNYVNHGPWRMFSTNGNVLAEGQYNMGERVGTWTRYHAKGESPIINEFPFNRFKPPFVSTANFTDGQMDGEWLIVDADERKCMQISIKMGERHGPAITWLPTGKTFRQATYDQGVPIGDVMEINNKTGELERSASYVDGRKVVTKASHHVQRKQKKTEAMYLAATTVQKTPDDFWTLRLATYASEGKDLRHGPAKAWYENGKQRLEGFYQQDKKNGTFTYWHPNGQTAATGEFKDDQFHGMWVWYYENGQKSSIGKYDSGAQLGEWRWWSEDGRLTKHKSYDGTERVSATKPETFELGFAPTEADTVVK